MGETQFKRRSDLAEVNWEFAEHLDRRGIKWYKWRSRKVFILFWAGVSLIISLIISAATSDIIYFAIFLVAFAAITVGIVLAKIVDWLFDDSGSL